MRGNFSVCSLLRFILPVEHWGRSLVLMVGVDRNGLGSVGWDH